MCKKWIPPSSALWCPFFTVTIKKSYSFHSFSLPTVRWRCPCWEQSVHNKIAPICVWPDVRVQHLSRHFSFTLSLVSQPAWRKFGVNTATSTGFWQFIWLPFFSSLSLLVWSSFPCCPMLHLSSSSHNSAKLILSNRFLHTKTGLCGWNLALCHRLLWISAGTLVMEGYEEKLWLCSLCWADFGFGELIKKAELVFIWNSTQIIIF